MADKRISQLIERTNIANNDVLPIVASGATTTNKVTISTIQTWMQDNLDVGVTSVGITIGSTGTDVNVTGSPVTSSGNITINIPTASATNRGLLSSANWTTFNNKVSSVGLSMPSAFSVANSPITGSGTIAVTGAGTVAQYIRGDGSLADFPQGGGGGGASVNYYLNGSVSQGSIGGIGYYEMNKVPVLGAGTDFVAIADGYLASFITDAGDPALLEIPAGNWNFETYFSASSGGGSPSFYIELYKVNSGGTATLIASNSATPELIAFGTVINPYFSTLAVPTTTLALTDRLALRYYVARSGRTITLHTENSHLCQIITTFTTGLTALNGLTAQVQNFATGTSGTNFGISSTGSTHTFNLPDASASARGVVTTGTQTFAGYKIFTGTIGVNNDLQLAAAGTASPTFIKNINGAGLTSIGSNGFGFNNSDNIYFSGSNKAGGVFAFNNTGNRTYTLQDASGTLAFTTDLSGYLPLTGGTLSNNLFITGGGLAVSGSTSANRQLLEVYTSGSVSRIAASYIGSSSYGDLELLTGGIARLTLASTGAATFHSSVQAGGTITSRTANYPQIVFSETTSSTDSLIFYDNVAATKNLGFRVNSGSNVMTLTSTNVGIGTNSPVTNLDIQAAISGAYTTSSSQAPLRVFNVTNAGGINSSVISLQCSTDNSASNPVARIGVVGESAGSNNGAMVMMTRDVSGVTERMRITSGGDVYLGSSTITIANTGWFLTKSAGLITQIFAYSSGTVVIQEFYRQAGGQIGSISYNGTITSYNSTSDYRLKEDLQDFNGLQIISKLKTYDFNWKDAGTRDYGMIAHELQEVLPSYVNGEKDAVDAEGNIKPQGVDYGKIVPILIKAIQELKTEIDSLKNQMQ